MPVTTVSAAVNITPVVIKVFFKHMRHKGHKLKDGEKDEVATDSILFDEGFHIVKAFIELGTRNTIESLQAFTNTHVPAPYWASVATLQISLTSCNKAADVLIDWFGPEDLKLVVGGERWWQVRGLDGIDAEWVTEKEYLSDGAMDIGRKLSDNEETILRMEHLESVMLYVHGGAYFWGSINTHRYQIIRYAREMKGRVFAVNYRKAPQYPWPCALQDVLSAYFYLTSPPPNALHKPIPPSKIVFAGDSAGAGLIVSLLTILRDLGLPQPAGAVLISPWVDLTHSFPSVMKNTATDIIPPHGFIHRPSPLWPGQPVPDGDRLRVAETGTNPPPKPGHTDTLRPSQSRVESQIEQCQKASLERGREVGAADLTDRDVGSQEQMQKMLASKLDEHDAGQGSGSGSIQGGEAPTSDYDLDLWEPKPPKVLMNDPHATPLELRSQIQIYATTEQLSHPLVSPVLQGSLGNLCPLYILSGDGELLRDEVIYLAHKAANPKEYPTRQGALNGGHRQKENAKKFQTPTKVHLQVFDGMCHVLTVFSFTDSAKYAYRSIAEFVKHVTQNDSDHLERNPFPELHLSSNSVSEDSQDPPYPKHSEARSGHSRPHPEPLHQTPPGDEAKSVHTDVDLYNANEENIKVEVEHGDAEKQEGSSNSSPLNLQREDIRVTGITLIRERVDIFGRVRLMEPKEKVEALCIPANLIGLIKEDPVKKWLEGQTAWDKKYRRSALRAIKRRQHYEKKAALLIDRAKRQGLILDSDNPSMPPRTNEDQRRMSSTSVGEIQQDRRWGPLDLEDENPPPSAIAGRQDTREAVALIKKHIYNSAPVTHRTVPRIKASDAVRAAFDPEDSPTKPPPQSVSEQQVHARVIPFHGLRMWQSIVSYFMHQSAKKAANGKNQAAAALRSTSDKIGGASPLSGSQDAKERK